MFLCFSGMMVHSSIMSSGYCMWGVLCLSAWVYSRFSDFLPPNKTLPVEWLPMLNRSECVCAITLYNDPAFASGQLAEGSAAHNFSRIKINKRKIKYNMYSNLFVGGHQ